MMDWNKFAAKITKFEGKKKSLSIAQVKEVLRIVACVIVSEPWLCFEFAEYGNRCISEIADERLKAEKKSPKRKAPKCKKK